MKGDPLLQRLSLGLAVVLILPLFAWLTPASAATMTFTNGQDPDMFLGGTTNVSATSLNMPYAMLIDPVSGKVFVSDTFNGRVLRYASYDELTESAAAEMVFGQTDFTSKLQPNPPTRSSLFQPLGLALDGQGNLWVVDNFLNRVLRYSDAVNVVTPGPDAAQVLGQSGFTSRSVGTGMNGFNSPYDIAVDSEGNLYVADSSNCRVLRFDDPTSLPEAGGAATVSIGDFVAGSAADANACPSRTQTGLGNSSGVEIDSQDRLYVADNTNHRRIMRWDDAPNLTSNAPADGVIGQVDFTALLDIYSVPQSGASFSNPFYIAVDNSDGIWVSDHGRSRILHFAEPWMISSGGEATTVLGAASMSDSSSPDFGFAGHAAVAPDGSLWVPDIFNHKVLKFATEPPPTPTPTATAAAGGGGSGGGAGQPTAVPACTQPATLELSPATLTIGAGETQTIDLALSNPCSTSLSPRSDVVVSLSPGLAVGNISSGVANLTTRAAIQNVILQKGERRSWQVSIVAPPDYAGNPQFVTELYSNGAVVTVRDSLAPAVTAGPTVEAAVEVPTAGPSAEAPVETALPEPTVVPIPAVLPATSDGLTAAWVLSLIVIALLFGVMRRLASRQG